MIPCPLSSFQILNKPRETTGDPGTVSHLLQGDVDSGSGDVTEGALDGGSGDTLGGAWDSEGADCFGD